MLIVNVQILAKFQSDESWVPKEKNFKLIMFTPDFILHPPLIHLRMEEVIQLN